MSCREAPRDRRQQRALDMLARGLARRAADMAVDALLQLPSESRAAHLAQVGALFRQEVERTHAAGQWTRLHYWSARAAGEPALVTGATPGATPDATPEAAREAWWALMWGAGLSKDFDRARRCWEPLAPAVTERSPRLAAAVESWLSTRGTPDPAVIAALGLAAPDPRLGHETVRPRVPVPPAPTRVEEVEPAVLGLFAREPWSVFAQTTGAWVTRAPAEVAARVRALGAALAVRETLQRLTASAPHPFDPLALLARFAAEAPSPEDLAADLLVAFRVAAGAPGGSRGGVPADLLGRVAGAAARVPAHRQFVLDAVLGLPFKGRTSGEVLGVLAAVFLRGAGRQGVGAGGAGLDRGSSPGPWGLDAVQAPPRWLSDGFAALAERDDLGAWLRAADVKARTDLVGFIGGFMPAPAVERLVDRTWAQADEPLRASLADLLLELLDEYDLSLDDLDDLDDLDGLDDGLGALLGGLRGRLQAGAMRLPEGRALWERFADRVLPYKPDFLDVAFSYARNAEERLAVAKRYVAGGPGIERMLEVVRAAGTAGHHHIAQHYGALALTAHAGDVEALARGLLWAATQGAPPGVYVPLGEALLEAHEARPEVRSPMIDWALDMARQLVPRRRKKKAAPRKPAKKPGAKKAAPRKPAKKPAKKPVVPPEETVRKAPPRPRKTAPEGGGT